MANLRPTDARIAATMLELAGDQFSNHGCNDYELPNTPDNLAFVRRLIAASDDPEDEPHGDGATLWLMDSEVMRYCAKILTAWADQQEEIERTTCPACNGSGTETSMVEVGGGDIDVEDVCSVCGGTGEREATDG